MGQILAEIAGASPNTWEQRTAKPSPSEGAGAVRLPPLPEDLQAAELAASRRGAGGWRGGRSPWVPQPSPAAGARQRR